MLVVLAIMMGFMMVVPVRKPLTMNKPRIGRVDMAVVLDVAAATLLSGNSVPDVLHSLGSALSGIEVGVKSSQGEKLHEVANMLVMGTSWEEAWEGVEGFDLFAQTLQPAWVDGVAPLPLLERGARTLRLTQARRAKEAAARLGEALVLPLGLCFLPAFVILGVVPVVAGAAVSLW
ncbi:Type II secretion system (T2SS), protein F [Arcanobacterium phocae]|uniref:Type II secretion system (T2SS), protein F n=1 Tax=Arcanobacterium phocae TaxID=131112 RepID=A0A1H2LDQ7_9ACTO|nr:type II secretion system F family protein [Arcanobacterium phocae]SDU78768.1 Type II secretion system (T2SS), protein F [Arcanobacterium phocae]